MTVSKEILALNRFDASRSGAFDADLSERIARREAAFGAASVLFYRQPIEMVRASGVFLFDAQGNRYLDAYNNVPSVGHCHPRVVEAIAAQAAALNIHTRYLNRVVENYADRLLACFPDPLSNLVMTCTGSESNDLALRLAQTATGAQGFIATRTAYHGNTALVMQVSPASARNSVPPPHVRIIAPPETGIDVANTFATRVAEAIAELKAEGFGFAGLIVDTIFSSDGIYADPAGFLQETLEVVHGAGGLFIADEVQPGFGRTGGGLWGFERHGIVPDIVTLGKPMGNGFPMGGVVTRPALLEPFCERFGYFNTFGGNPIAAAAGLAVLDIINEEDLVGNARRVGEQMKQQLIDLQKTFSQISEVRGAGLFIGVEFSQETGEPDQALASQVINGLREHHILIGSAGQYGNILKIRPPLCFSSEHADILTDGIRSVLTRLKT